jgi:hypothetical protein
VRFSLRRILSLLLSLTLPLTPSMQEASDTSFGDRGTRRREHNAKAQRRKDAKGATPTSELNREMAAGFACWCVVSIPENERKCSFSTLGTPPCALFEGSGHLSPAADERHFDRRPWPCPGATPPAQHIGNGNGNGLGLGNAPPPRDAAVTPPMSYRPSLRVEISPPRSVMRSSLRGPAAVTVAAAVPVPDAVNARGQRHLFR